LIDGGAGATAAPAKAIAWVERRKERLPLIVLGVAMAAAAALLIWESRGQTLFADEWYFYAGYRGRSLETFLRPENGHLIPGTVLVYKAVFKTFGAGSYTPLVAIHIILSLVCAGLFFELARRAVGNAVAVAATLPLLFLGASAEVITSAIGITELLATGSGLAALVAVERGDRVGDVAACALLIVGVASFSPALAFVPGVLVAVLLREKRDSWRRSWVALVPAALYLSWRLWASLSNQPDLGSGLTVLNVGDLPAAAFDQLATAAAALSGLFRFPGQSMSPLRSDWGEPLGLILIALAILRFRKGPPVDRRIWVFVTCLLAYWLSIALVLGPDRILQTNRYQYQSVALLLLVLCQLGAGLRFRPAPVAAAIGVALVMSLSANLVALHYAARADRHNAKLNLAELGALRLAAGRAPPDVTIEPVGSKRTVNDDLLLPFRQYYSAAAEYGTPADSLAELAAEPEYAREAADHVLAKAYLIAPRATAAPIRGSEPAPPVEAAALGAIRHRGGCLALRPQAGQSGVFRITVPPGGFSLRAPRGAAVRVDLRRFADAFSVPLPPQVGGTTADVAIPRDASPQPWHAQIATAYPVTACAISGPKPGG
jgi:hypothetical protein